MSGMLRAHSGCDATDVLELPPADASVSEDDGLQEEITVSVWAQVIDPELKSPPPLK